MATEKKLTYCIKKPLRLTGLMLLHSRALHPSISPRPHIAVVGISHQSRGLIRTACPICMARPHRVRDKPGLESILTSGDAEQGHECDAYPLSGYIAIQMVGTKVDGVKL